MPVRLSQPIFTNTLIKFTYIYYYFRSVLLENACDVDVVVVWVALLLAVYFYRVHSE